MARVTKDDYQVGVVAVDDFDLWVGPCTMEKLSCNFESGSCGWSDDKSYPLEWVRAEARMGAESIGYDHTTSSGEGKVFLLL